MLSIGIGADSKQSMPDNKADKVLATLASYGGLMIITTISIPGTFVGSALLF